MSWQPLATIQTSDEWVLTEPVSGSVFRAIHNVTGTNIQSLRGVISQAFTDSNTNTYFDFRRLAYKPETEGFIFIQPGGLLNRKLAIKRLDNLSDSWSITIEVLDGMPESISLPIEISEVSGLLEELQARVSRLEFLEHAADTETNPHKVTLAQVGGERPGAGAAAAADAIATHESTVNHPAATESSKGMMAADDKLKLNGIESGATRVTGLGDAAFKNTGTAAGTVAAGDDTRLSNARTPTGTAGGDLTGTYPNPTLRANLFSRSLANPGWQRIYGGQLEEFGTSVITLNANGDGTVLYPLAFPTAVLVPQITDGGSFLTFTVQSPPYSLTGFTFRCTPNPGAVNVRVNWIVKGY